MVIILKHNFSFISMYLTMYMVHIKTVQLKDHGTISVSSELISTSNLKLFLGGTYCVTCNTYIYIQKRSTCIIYTNLQSNTIISSYREEKLSVNIKTWLKESVGNTCLN
jgi:hypothetical protein